VLGGKAGNEGSCTFYFPAASAYMNVELKVDGRYIFHKQITRWQYVGISELAQCLLIYYVSTAG